MKNPNDSTQPVPDPPLDRREFCLRSLKAGAIAAAALGIGYWRHETRLPDAPQGSPQTVTMPDFALTGVKPMMSVVRGRDRAASLERAIAALGGIETFIHKGDRVLIKVNAVFASPPVLCATTHPDILSPLIRLCFNAGAETVTVTDNPINDPASCFALTGIERAALAEGARVLIPGPSDFRPLSVAGGTLIRDWPFLYTPFDRVNKLIGLAPVKNHQRSGASLSLKNWYGLLGGRRNVFHQDIHNIIKELGMMVSPTLVILDGTVSMIANGPTGGSMNDLAATETVIASTDMVAADAYAGRHLLNMALSDLPFLARAEEAGVGTTDYEALNPIRLEVGS